MKELSFTEENGAIAHHHFARVSEIMCLKLIPVHNGFPKYFIETADHLLRF